MCSAILLDLINPRRGIVIPGNTPNLAAEANQSQEFAANRPTFGDIARLKTMAVCIDEVTVVWSRCRIDVQPPLTEVVALYDFSRQSSPFSISFATRVSREASLALTSLGFSPHFSRTRLMTPLLTLIGLSGKMKDVARDPATLLSVPG